VAKVDVYRGAGRPTAAFSSTKVAGVIGAWVTVIAFRCRDTFLGGRVADIDDAFVVILNRAGSYLERAFSRFGNTAVDGAVVSIVTAFGDVDACALLVVFGAQLPVQTRKANVGITTGFTLRFTASVGAYSLYGVFAVVAASNAYLGVAAVYAAAVSVVAVRGLKATGTGCFVTAVGRTGFPVRACFEGEYTFAGAFVAAAEEALIERSAFSLDEYAAICRTRVAIIRCTVQVVVAVARRAFAQTIFTEVVGAGVSITAI